MIDCGDSVGWRLEALFTALQAFNHNEPDKKYRQMVENMSCGAESWWDKDKDSDNDEDSVGLPILSPVTNRSRADWYPRLGGNGALRLAASERRRVQVDRGHWRCWAATLRMCKWAWSDRGYKKLKYSFLLFTAVTFGTSRCCSQTEQYLCQIQWREDNELEGS